MAPPVLLLHGLATSAQRTWVDTGWVDLLQDEGRTVIAPDLLGHGNAAKPHDPEAYEQLEDQVLDLLPAEPVDAVGFSLGARILLFLAGTQPHRFRRLVFAGVGANLFRSEEGVAAPAIAAGRSEDPILGHFARLAREDGADPAAIAACASRRHPRLTEELYCAITHPALVVLGDRDFTGPADPLLERLPSARLVALHGVDHFATPKSLAFLDQTLRFLA